MKIYNLLYYFQLSCFFLSFIFSVRTIGNKNVPAYMKWFFIYSFVAFAGFTAITIIRYLSPEKREMLRIFTILSIVFHYFFLALFFNRLLVAKKNRLIFRLILLCSVPFVIVTIVKNISELDSMDSFSVVNFCLLVFCTFYYYELFTSPPKGSLLNEPSFWIVSGIFFSMGMTIPVNLIAKYLKVTLSEDVFKALISIGFFAYGIMHLFFTKAYICSLATKKVS